MIAKEAGAIQDRSPRNVATEWYSSRRLSDSGLNICICAESLVSRQLNILAVSEPLGLFSGRKISRKNAMDLSATDAGISQLLLLMRMSNIYTFVSIYFL